MSFVWVPLDERNVTPPPARGAAGEGGERLGAGGEGQGGPGQAGEGEAGDHAHAAGPARHPAHHQRPNGRRQPQGRRSQAGSQGQGRHCSSSTPAPSFPLTVDFGTTFKSGSEATAAHHQSRFPI